MGLPLVISDYRSRKILKRYQVTPVSPAMLLFVQVTIYTLYAVVSLLLLYFAAALFFGYRFRGSVLNFAGGYLLVLVSMFSIGMLVGGVACGHAEGSGYSAVNAGNQAAEGRFPWAGGGKRAGVGDCDGGDCCGLYWRRNPGVSVGIGHCPVLQSSFLFKSWLG